MKDMNAESTNKKTTGYHYRDLKPSPEIILITHVFSINPNATSPDNLEEVNNYFDYNPKSPNLYGNVALVNVDTFTAKIKVVKLVDIPESIKRPTKRTSLVVRDCCKGLFVNLNSSTKIKHTSFYKQTYPIIARLLTTIGVKKGYVGYRHLIESILFIVDDWHLISSLEQKVFAKFTLQDSCKIINIQRNIRTLLEASWKNSAAFQSYSQAKPTPRDFIASIADEVRLKLNKI